MYTSERFLSRRVSRTTMDLMVKGNVGVRRNVFESTLEG